MCVGACLQHSAKQFITLPQLSCPVCMELQGQSEVRDYCLLVSFLNMHTANTCAWIIGIC